MILALENAPFDWTVLDRQTRMGQWLFNGFKRKKLPQVLLIEGPKGLGKGAWANYLAALHFCPDACGHCQDCHRLLNQEHEEVKFYTGDEKISIEEASDIQEHLSYHAVSADSSKPSRIVIVTKLERLTRQAANRLLKTLEEPGEDALVIATSESPRDLPETILSRCCRLPANPYSPKESLRIIQQLGVKYLTPAKRLSDEELENGIRKGIQPWMFLESTKSLRTANEAENLLLEFLKSNPTAIDVLDFCETQFRKNQSEINIFAASYERILNRHYRHIFQNGGKGYFSSNPRLTANRRRLLFEIRQKAGREKIHLNGQLAAEALLNAALMEKSQ